MNFHVYILYSKKLNRFYIGHTTNLENRLIEHNSGESLYTSQGMPCKLVWSTIKENYRQAEDLEFKLKNLSKARKTKFMNKYEEGIVDIELLQEIELRTK